MNQLSHRETFTAAAEYSIRLYAAITGSMSDLAEQGPAHCFDVQMEMCPPEFAACREWCLANREECERIIAGILGLA